MKTTNVYFNKKWFRVLKIADKILSFLYRIIGQTQPQKVIPHHYKTILIMESHLIGDIIMSLPAYYAIRESFPNAIIIFWGNKWGQELLSGQNLFNKFIITKIPWAVYDYSFSAIFKLLSQAIKLRKMRVDLAIEFRGDIRNIFSLYLTKARKRVSFNFTGGSYWLTDIASAPKSLHIVDRNLSLIREMGIKIKHSLPKLKIADDKLEEANKYLKGKGDGEIIFIHPGASQRKRIWSDEKFASVINFLHYMGYTVFLTCGPQDKDLIDKIKNTCKIKPHILSIPLTLLPAYLSFGKLFIGTDSGIAHIAAALGKNVLVLFGPQLPSLTAPRGEGTTQVIIKDGFDCRPCSDSFCPYNNKCMNAIEFDDLKNAIEQQLMK